MALLVLALGNHQQVLKLDQIMPAAGSTMAWGRTRVCHAGCSEAIPSRPC